jgi:hypothetical protein
LEQIHPSGNGVQGLDDFSVEISQVNDAYGDSTLYCIKLPSVFFRRNEQHQ